jgi:acylphosphatase
MESSRSVQTELQTVSKLVRYKGRVQGVGFRYATQRLAQGCDVAGYVRNLPNGDVELVAQGAPDQVTAFLDALAGRMKDYIEKTFVTDGAPGSYQGFRIRY